LFSFDQFKAKDCQAQLAYFNDLVLSSLDLYLSSLFLFYIRFPLTSLQQTPENKRNQRLFLYSEHTIQKESESFLQTSRFASLTQGSPSQNKKSISKEISYKGVFLPLSSQDQLNSKFSINSFLRNKN
jgi:hypothetical protein